MTPTSTSKRIGLFAGSFRPFTRAHADIVERGLSIFDEIVVGIGVNPAKAEEADADIAAINALYADNPRVSVRSYNTLTIDLAKKIGATALLRGIRSVKDFEYERDLADVNRQLSGLETVILYSRPEYAAVSSSLVRELRAFGHDAARFLP